MTTILPETFDPNTAEPSTFNPIPPGEYLAHITETSTKPPHSGDGVQILFTLKILDGEYEGRQLWLRFPFQYSNVQAEAIGRRMLKDACDAIGYTDHVSDLEISKLKPLRIRVVIEVDKNGQYPDKNRVRRILPAIASSK